MKGDPLFGEKGLRKPVKKTAKVEERGANGEEEIR
jgi:hypothetical protein